MIFSYIRRLGTFFGFKILNFNILGGFQKNKYSFGYEDFMDIFLGHHKFGLYLRVISTHFSVFLKAMVQNGDIFWGLLKFQYFLGCLKFLIFFGGEA